MSKKVAVIFLDALEYDLVEKLDLKNLKQREYGKVEVPKRRTVGSNFPTTPAVMATFLTGKLPEEHGIWRFKQSNSFMNFLSKIPVLGIDRIFRRVFKIKSNFVMPNRDELGYPTLVDEIPNTVEVNFPYYSNEAHKEEMENLKDILGDEITAPEIKKNQDEQMQNTLEEVLSEIKKDWSLFLCYFGYLDGIQHGFSFDKNYVKECYEKCEKAVEKIKEKIPEKAWVLILSDHGFSLSKGTHSHHGFYSSNKKLNLDNPHITDFTNLIKKEFKVPTKEEKKKIKQELEKLGYI